VLDGTGKLSAYETDLKWARDVPEDLYYATEITRRYFAITKGFMLPTEARVPYLRALLAALGKKKGAAGATALLRTLRANLLDATYRERMYKLQDRTGVVFYDVATGAKQELPVPDFLSLEYLNDVTDAIVQDLDQVLGSPTSMTSPLAPAWVAVAPSRGLAA
jgi:hypothetical protein